MHRDAPIPPSYLVRFWHWTIKSRQLPKWQKAFNDRESKVKNAAFEHGVSVGLEQAKHQPEMKTLYKKYVQKGIRIGLELFDNRRLSDKELNELGERRIDGGSP